MAMKRAKKREKRVNTIPASNEQVLIPVPDWNKYYSWPSVSGLRHLIFDAENNGFDKCIRHVGKRVLIYVPSFLEWVDEQDKQYKIAHIGKKQGNRGRR